MKQKYATIPACLFALIFLLQLNAAKSQIAGNWNYASQAGGLSPDATKGIVTDPSGNSFVTGYYTDSITFNGISPIKLKTPGGLGSEIFLAKYDPSGQIIWATSAGGKLADLGYGITMDVNSDILITGTFSSDTAVFWSQSYSDSDTLFTSGGTSDIFVAKYDSSGNLLWLSSHGGSGNDYSYKIKTDAFGGIYLTGAYASNPIYFYGTNTDSLPRNGTNDMFLASFDINGNVLWATHAGGTGSSYGYGLDIDSWGNTYVAGSFTGTDTFYTATGTFSLTTVGSNDAFITKFDPNGNTMWAQQAGSVLTDQANNVAVSAGSCYITGNHGNSCTFYGTTNVVLGSYGLSDIFLARYDTSGNIIWAKHAGGSSSDFSNGICPDGNGNVFVGGYFQNTATFTGNLSALTVTSAGSGDMFVALYDSMGYASCVQQGGGTGSDRVWDISSQGLSAYVAGEFAQTATFTSVPSTFTLTSAGGSDAFVGEWMGCAITTAIHTNQTSFILYPNPSSGEIHLLFDNISSPIVPVEITDVTGKQVSSETLYPVNGEAILQTDLSNGIYFVRMNSNSTSVTRKLIINR
jgi:hypothetical protein